MKVEALSSERRRIEKAKLEPIYERRRERGLIIKELRNHPCTIPELSKATGLQTSNVFRHVIALSQFGQVTVVGEKDDHYVYGLTEKQG